MSSVVLEEKNIGDICGNFTIPDYQRGYRWGKEEVEMLLNDIYENAPQGYCLQPIVVQKENDKLILIDGQQRLTTIYLIYQYIYQRTQGLLGGPQFTLHYDTRADSQEFLKNIGGEEDFARKDSYIDFWFIAEAYETIKDWFEVDRKNNETVTLITQMLQYFQGVHGNVKVIWYEVENEDGNKLFQRLNIGKIRLTSAELIKAMFLSATALNHLKQERQNEIASQWDSIERELHDKSFWGFLSNASEEKYPTRIDLILDIIAKKTEKSKGEYFTFFAFAEKRKIQSLVDIWTNEIVHAYLILKDWFEQDDLYHKIGYLITCGAMTLPEIYEMYKSKTKAAFHAALDDKIKKSVTFKKAYALLNYHDDRQNIQNLLLLFNVQTMKKGGSRFPFERYKSKENGARWSLEHIHAQHSQGLATEKAWREWLNYHLPAVEVVRKEESLEIASEIKEMLANKKIESRQAFEMLQEKIVLLLSADNKLQTDNLGNLALLDTSCNAALNNSTFFVKRGHIIEMDMEGKFIPPCTKNAFLKYYSPQDAQPYFWSKQDGDNYVEEMNKVLREYCDGEITLNIVEEEI